MATSNSYNILDHTTGRMRNLDGNPFTASAGDDPSKDLIAMSDPLELLFLLGRNNDLIIRKVWIVHGLELARLRFSAGDGFEVPDQEGALARLLDAADTIDVNVDFRVVSKERRKLDEGVGESHDAGNVFVMGRVSYVNVGRSAIY